MEINKNLMQQWKEKWEAWSSDIRNWETLACALILIGVFVLPIHFRYGILNKLADRCGYINVLAFLAVCIFMKMKKEFTRGDKVMVVLWMIATAIIIVSDHANEAGRSYCFLFQSWIPALMVLYKFDKSHLRWLLRFILRFFNIFVIVLLIIAIIERTSGEIILRTLRDLFNTGELKGYVKCIIPGVPWRFFSVWGHPLTNAVYFNAFYIMNEIYHRCIGKKFKRLPYFIIALAGVLLCSSKSAMVVLGIYFLITCWEQKWLYLVFGGGGVALYFAGAFSSLITRLKVGSLTTGRIEADIEYFTGDYSPLLFWKGYGTGFTFEEELYPLKAGFEWPPLMWALHYGILFAIIASLFIYIYVSYHILKKKRIVCWMGYSAMIVQMYTYNGLSMHNQDCFIFLCLFSLFVVNCMALKNKKTKKQLIE